MKLPHQWGKRTKGSDIPKRVKKLNISVLDFQEKNAVKASGQRLGSAEAARPEGHKIPQDIASAILFQSEDFTMLKCLVLVNKCFHDAFQSSRISVMHVVALNMFGADIVNYALILARFMCHPSTLHSEGGKIELVAPDKTKALPQELARKAQMIHHVVNKWIELYEVQQSWMVAPKKGKKSKEGEVKVDALSETECSRFTRALVLFWMYGHCAGRVRSTGYGGYSAKEMEKTALCDQLSNFELAEVMGVYSFFESIFSTVCEECQLEGDDGYLYWQNYCLSRGPLWFLQLLKDYDAPLAQTYGGTDEGFLAYHMMSEGEKRGIEFEFGNPDDLSDSGHLRLDKTWKGAGIDGDFRPSSSGTPAGGEVGIDSENPIS